MKFLHLILTFLVCFSVFAQNLTKDKKLIELTYSFIEIYFRNKVNIKNIEILNFYTLFLKKIINTKIYNLDEESIFMEFEDRILNG